MRTLLLLGAVVGLTGSYAPAAQINSAQSASSWEIGPVYRWRNSSVGMPLNPSPLGNGWYFDFPFPDRRAGHVHYVTFQSGPLVGKSHLAMRYRVDAFRGVRFMPQETPYLPATVSLYFQRRGDNWSARGRYDFYRWYAPLRTVRRISPGEYEMVVSLQDNEWVSVKGKRASAHREAFANALADTDRVGILFGTDGARGHGVYASGPARFTLISFQLL